MSKSSIIIAKTTHATLDPRNAKGRTGRPILLHTTTTMLKPRLRIPRSGGLLRPTSTPISSSCSPFALAAAAPKLHQQRRSFQTHRVPTLPYADKFLSEGVPNLYSKEGFAAAWNIYMEWCLGKLNERIAGTFGSDTTSIFSDKDGQKKHGDANRRWDPILNVYNS